MTNTQIIMNLAQDLAKEGKIQYTGKTFDVELPDGTILTIQETEEIHTYARWKAEGRQVKKGEKALAKAMIWKFVKYEDRDPDEEQSRMFMKNASFFSYSQTQEAE